MEFTYEEVKKRFETFVQNFLSDEENVKRVELFPKVWLVSIEKLDFAAMITCESRLNGYGFEDWFAVVSQEGEEDRRYLLFEEELKQWLDGQRRKKMWEKFDEK